jgi:hypothetical protein
MLKLAFLSVAALSAVAAGANGALAQCACSGSGSMAGSVVAENTSVGPAPMAMNQTSDAQSYQRFSYSPTESTLPSVIASPAPMMSMAQAMPSSQYVAGPQVQTYRRFSYQPSAQSNRSNVTHKKPQWSYPKTDSRRYSN